MKLIVNQSIICYHYISTLIYTFFLIEIVFNMDSLYILMLNEKLLIKASQEKASCLNKWQYI